MAARTNLRFAPACSLFFTFSEELHCKLMTFGMHFYKQKNSRSMCKVPKKSSKNSVLEKTLGYKFRLPEGRSQSINFSKVRWNTSSWKLALRFSTWALIGVVYRWICAYQCYAIDSVTLLSVVMPHYPPVGQMMEIMWGVDEESAPIAMTLIAAEDALTMAMFSIYCIVKSMCQIPSNLPPSLRG